MTLRRYSLFIKVLFLLILYLAHGRPFIGAADYGYALLIAYLLLFGDLRDRFKPILVASGLTLLALSHFIPQLEISEQTRLLLNTNKQYIPPGHFLKDSEKYPFFLTADGYVQGYKDKRFVHTIDIDDGIRSLRGGWINRTDYNFYTQVSSYVRSELPFVVRYEIGRQLVGMTLTLEGLLLFERDGRFKIHDPALKNLQIKAEHVGSALVGFGGQWDDTGYNDLEIKLEKTLSYKLYDMARACSSLFSVCLLFFGLFSIHLTRDFGLQSILLSISSLSFWIYSSTILRLGIVAKGGADGIAHDGYAYQMLEKWAAGDWSGALMSPEHVFYYMPGMRYVRFAEMLLFGDSYILQVCLLLFVPVILYRFFSVFLTQNLSFALCVLSFAHMFDGIGLSAKLYSNSLMNLYGEGFAYALLFIAITLLAKSIQKIEGGIFAFFLLAICLSIRPNLGIFIAIVALTHLFTTTFSPQPLIWRFVMLFGFAPVLLIPIHNILGGELVLVSKASQISENLPLSLELYYQAICNLLGLTHNNDYGSRFTNHFQQFYPQYILAWGGGLWLSFKGQTPMIKTFALAVLAGISVHLFYLPVLRYIHPYLTIAIVLGLYQVPRFRVGSR
jgi:hypothetical protein